MALALQQWTPRAKSRARQELVRRGSRSIVTAVALNSGFTQLGRFAAEYRKAFGELPSATINRAKCLSTSPFDEDIDEAIRQTLDALPFAFAVERTQCSIALEKLSRPQKVASAYGLPRAVASWCWAQRAAHNFGSTPDADRERAYRLAEEAVELAPDNALTLTLSSGTPTWRSVSSRRGFSDALHRILHPPCRRGSSPLASVVSATPHLLLVSLRSNIPTLTGGDGH